MAKSFVYSKEGTHRESLRKNLMQVGLAPSFTQDVSSVSNLIAEIKPVLFMLDWHSLDLSRNATMLRNINNSDPDGLIMKIICCDQIEPEILALASETNVRKVLTYGTLALEMKKVLSLLQIGNTDDHKFNISLKNLRDAGTEQEKINEFIQKSYDSKPDLSDIRIEYANMILLNGEIDPAMNIAVELLKENNVNVRAMNLLSRIYMKNGDFESATKILEKAEVLSPKNPSRLAMLGDAYYGGGKKDKATTAYSEALNEDPKNPDAVKGLGTIKLEEGDTQALVELFSAHSSEAETAGFFNNAAVQNVREGKLEESLELYGIALKALKSDKFKSLIYFNTGLNYRRLKRYEEAIKSMKRAVKYNPKFEKAKKQLEDIENMIAKKSA